MTPDQIEAKIILLFELEGSKLPISEWLKLCEDLELYFKCKFDDVLGKTIFKDDNLEG